MATEFHGKEGLIIGGTSGIGKAVAQRILKDGGKVTIVGRNGGKLESAVKELSRHGEVRGVQLDIMNRNAVKGNRNYKRPFCLDRNVPKTS